MYRFQKSPSQGPFSKPALLLPKHAVCMWTEGLKREKKNNLCFQKYPGESGQGLRANDHRL